MFQIRAKLIYNKRVKDNYFRLSLEAPRMAGEAKPGQFVNIKINDNCQPLLRRPFSIHRVVGSYMEIIYEVVGKGTEIFSQSKAGEFLDIIGPLGNGFDLRSATCGLRPILVAGGMGVAPLIFLAERLTRHHVTPSTALGASTSPRHQVVVLIGAKTKKEILCEKEFKNLGCSVKIATDNGSRGFKGKVTDLLRKTLRLAISDKRLAIYACGPKPMLQEISRISKEHKIPAQISLEEHLACGIGACLGCVVNTRQGFKRVCKEGPVFDAKEIIWSNEPPLIRFDKQSESKRRG